MKKIFQGFAALPFVAGAAFAQQPAQGAKSGVAGYIDNLQILNSHDAYGGASFGDVGPYTVITGIVHGKLDPRNPANAGIVDLKLAPRDAAGLVDYSADVVILRPKSAAKAKRVLFYDVVNRGNKGLLNNINGGGRGFEAGQQGNGLLLRLGYTLVWSGWQGDIGQTGHGDTAALGTNYPVAVNPGGSAITGRAREEYVLDESNGIDYKGGPAQVKLTYPAATLDKAKVTFDWRPTWRTSSDPLTEGMKYTAPSTPVPAANWSYNADGTGIQFTLPPGSDPGSIFEFVYTAKNPVVMGTSFAALRDLITFLNYDQADHAGNPNPLADLRGVACSGPSCHSDRNFDVTVMEGVSESGRFARDFLWQGFNDNARPGNAKGGRMVFNGMFPIIAGSRKMFINDRWGQPGRWSKGHADHWQPGDQFPFAYNVTTDPVTGRTDGLLKKCLTNDTCPKIVQLDGGFEAFGARTSLVTTDGKGHDLQIPANVRLYEVPGASHLGAAAGVATLTQVPLCVNPPSQVIETTIERALAPELVDWVANGVAPADSQYPSVAAGTLAPPTDREKIGFPDLSAAGYPYHGDLYNPLVVTTYKNAIPMPDLSKPYTVLVSKTDADGNALGGVRVPEIVAPIGTYADWNVRGPGHSPGDACHYYASTLPFAATKADRQAKGDPRLSFQERYASKDDYVAKVKAAAEALVTQRLLLAEDVAAYVKAAEAETQFP